MNRLIVVTGASSGIGKSIVEKFAKNGDQVLMIARNSDLLLKTISDIKSRVKFADLDYIALDMSKIDSVSYLLEKISKYDRLVSSLICCAGSASPTIGIDISSISNEWIQSFNSNVMTSVFAVEGLSSVLEDDGSIVLFSSIAAYRGSGGTGAYGAMKSALHSYAHTLATRLANRNINVNVIAPGYISETNFFGNHLTNDRKNMLVNQTLLGRSGKPCDCAGLCFYLCSIDSKYITSQILQINGGSNHGI